MKTTQISSTKQEILNKITKPTVKKYNFDILAEEYYKLAEKRKKLQEQEQELKDRLETYVVGLNATAYMGKKFVMSSYERKGNVDYEAIPVLKNIDLEKFRKDPIVCWKVTKI